MRNYEKWLSAAFLTVFCAASAEALEIKAKNAILTDYDTGEIL